MSNDIPAGRYAARATGQVEFGKNDRIGVRFELLNEGYQGRYVTWFQGFSNEVGVDIGMRGLRDAGWTGDDLATIGPETGLGSTEVELGISYRIWENKPQMDVKVFSPGGGAIFLEEKKLDPGGIAALAARLKGAAIKSKRAGRDGGAAPPPFLARASAAPSARDWDGQGAEPTAGSSYVRTPFDDDAPHDGRDPSTGEHAEAPSEHAGDRHPDSTPF